MRQRECWARKKVNNLCICGLVLTGDAFQIVSNDSTGSLDPVKLNDSFANRASLHNKCSAVPGELQSKFTTPEKPRMELVV